MPDGLEEIHHRFIHRANALSEQFAGAANLTAAAYGQKVEGVLVRLLKAIDQVEGNPYESPQIRDAINAMFKQVQAVGIEFFGPGSDFEGQTKRVMASMARNGLEKLQAEFRAQRFVLKQTVLDRASILAAATDSYALAARNLSTIEPLREIFARELIQGNGTMSLAQSLASAGYLVDGQELPLIEPLVRGGRTYTVQQRAMMMARTEPRRLQSMAYLQGTAKVEPDPKKRVYRWVSVLAPTSTEDSLVRHGHVLTKPEWDTTLWPTDNWTGFPPLRPNDRCSVIFYREDWLSPENRKALKETEPTSDQRAVLTDEQRSLLASLRPKGGVQAPPTAPKRRTRPPATPGAASGGSPAPKPKPQAPAPAGPPTFNTVAEAEDWIRASGTVEGQVTLAGAAPDAANRVVAFLHDFVAQQKLPKLKQLTAEPNQSYSGAYRPGARRIFLGQPRLDAAKANAAAAEVAAQYGVRANQIAAELEGVRARASAAEDAAAALKAQRRGLKRGTEQYRRLTAQIGDADRLAKFYRRGANAYERGAVTRRPTVSNSGDGNAVWDTLVHEYGHMLHDLMEIADRVMVEQFGAQPGGWMQRMGYGYTRLGGKYRPGQLPTYSNLFGGSNSGNLTAAAELEAARVSEYAAASTIERFAESFAAYMRGEKHLLTAEVRQVVEEVLEAARVRGAQEWGS